MKKRLLLVSLLGVAAVFALTGISFGAVSESGCVTCHTDAEKLKSITDKLPKKEKSAETAGSG
ncbi:MAG: hypothetical protein JRG73_03355 [Deltaproteobacteria bacterium]|nr:hypothetical protein [Deltaproteobacteria bacterium]MBW2305949.1 hypothetical protein [Deltaproteobacteria bacterium]